MFTVSCQRWVKVLQSFQKKPKPKQQPLWHIPHQAMECMHTWLHQRCFNQVRGTASWCSLNAKEIQTFLPQTANLYFSDKYHPLYFLQTSCRNCASLQHLPTAQGLKYFRWQQKFNGIGRWVVSNCFVHHLYIFLPLLSFTFPFLSC